MNYKLVYIASVVIIVLASCGTQKHASTKKLPGTWQATPIIVDGSNKDWAGPYAGYDEKAQLGYVVSNDKDNLYISVETGDLATQLKILRNGLTVWIDRTNEKNRQTAINFPIPQDINEDDLKNKKSQSGQWVQFTPGSQDAQRMELEDKVRAAMADDTEYSLQGFKSCNLQYHIKDNDSCGIVVRIGIDTDNELVWEAVIPFRTFYPKADIDKRDKGKPMCIGIETVGLKRPIGQPANNNNVSRGPAIRPGIGFGVGGVGMNMGGGGMRTPSRGRTQTNMNTLEPAYKSTMTWKSFGIAVQ